MKVYDASTQQAGARRVSTSSGAGSGGGHKLQKELIKMPLPKSWPFPSQHLPLWV